MEGLHRTPDRDIMLRGKTIAVVGLSKDPSKDSHSVSAYMKRKGYKIIPVNPTAGEILGERSYPSLLDIPGEIARTIDIVNIFRPSDQVAPIVEQAIKLRERFKDHPKAIWMQLGIEDDASTKAAQRSGMEVVQNMCIAVEHRRMIRSRGER